VSDNLKPLLLVTTCGTSLLTNFSGEDRRRFTQLSNLTDEELRQNDEDHALVEGLKKRVAEALVGKPENDLRKASAELNGAVLAMRRSVPRIAHLLVHSDTALGRGCAELVKSAIPGLNESMVLLTAGGLRTDDVANFRSALDDLTKKLVESVETYQENGYAVCFNLSGGWKSVNAYLQGVAMILGIPCVFVFEGSDEVLEIPRLPARLDADEVLKIHHDVFRRLDSGYALTATDADGIPESLLTEIDGTVGLSLWGEVLWSQARNAIFGESLLPSLSQRLCFSKAAENNFLEITERSRRIEVQRKLDWIAFILDTKKNALEHLAALRSVNLKPLRGNPKPPSTHEFDLWHDGSAWRAYVHFDGEKMICDSLGKALH